MCHTSTSFSTPSFPLSFTQSIPLSGVDAPKDLISKLLVVDPAKRITVQEALTHDFFQILVRLEALCLHQCHAAFPLSLFYISLLYSVFSSVCSQFELLSLFLTHLVPLLSPSCTSLLSCFNLVPHSLAPQPCLT